MNSYIIKIPCIVMLLYLFGCSGESSPERVVLHPITEKIPHYDLDHILIDTTRQFQELVDKPDKLVTFHQYLQNSASFRTEKLEIMVGGYSRAFNVIFLQQDRLIVLDAANDHLFEYDLNTHTPSTLAEFGRGPGDIQFPMELAKQDNTIYVVRRDMYISQYNCNFVPCVFHEAISLEFGLNSIAFKDEAYAVLGSPVIRQSPGPTTDLDNVMPVHLIDLNGRKTGSFGDIYDTGGHWPLLRPFVTEGRVRYSPSEHVFILTFERFPFLYIYDADHLDLKETYEISDFVLGQQRYWPETGELEIVLEDHGRITKADIIDEKFLLLEVEIKRNSRVGDRTFLWDRQIDYYVVDLGNQESYYMGSIEKSGDDPEKNYFITQDGLIIYEEGSLYWAKM